VAGSGGLISHDGHAAPMHYLEYRYVLSESRLLA